MKTNLFDNGNSCYASPQMHAVILAEDTPVLCVSSALETFDGVDVMSPDRWNDNF